MPVWEEITRPAVGAVGSEFLLSHDVAGGMMKEL